jgi:membrane protein involved in colicin uptake
MTEERTSEQQEQSSDESRNTEQQQRQDERQQQQQQVYRTQEDFDAAFARRLERERKKLREEWDAEKAEIERKAKMDEAERIKAEKEEAEKKASEYRTQLQAERLNAAAERAAIAAGAKPEQVAKVVRLAELGEVEFTDGKPDPEAVEQAISAVLEEIPELKAGSKTVGTSTNPANGSDEQQEEFEKMGYQERVALYNRDPDLFRRLSASGP